MQRVRRDRLTMRPASVTRLAGRSLLLVASLLLGACDDSSGPPDPPTGALQLSVSGLPDTIPADISIAGPAGYSTRLTSSQTLEELTPGEYTITTARVVTAVATFDPAIQTLSLTVGANAVSQATVIYAVTTGSIAVAVGGLPPDVPWVVHVTGPASFRDSVSSNRTLGNLAPGTYTLSAGERQKGQSIYAPTPSERTVSVTPSIAPIPAVITYTLITGTLMLHVNGLPAGVNGDITVSGPNGFAATASGPRLFEGLLHGHYVISAAPASGGQHVPAPASQNVTVVPGAIGQVTVNYWPTTQPGLNLRIDAMQVQQVVQTYGGAVPLIAGRDALLRIFVRASATNGASPRVQVLVDDGVGQLGSFTIAPPATGVPTTIDEGALQASWNVQLPGAIVRPGIRILARVDPDNSIAESDESDNSYPLSSTPLAMDVRNSPPLAVRLVPVAQTATGLTGDVSSANASLYADAVRRLLPIDQLLLDVRQPYTTNAPALQPNDGNGAWVQLLNEILALRAAEGASAHYYGVVKVPYTSGVIGISYFPSFVAVGSDGMPTAPWTFVHEMGHNFGRLHAPSCGAGGFDANYPYPNGTIGVWGYDAAAGLLKPPSTPDIMGYCDGRWISDYTFTGILSFRTSPLAALTAWRAPARPGLLVWGRIGAAGLVLEPAFEVNAPARLPALGGPHTLEVVDSAGRTLVSLRFSGERTIDTPRAEEQFAFVIPLDLLGGSEPAGLRLSSPGRQTAFTSRPGGNSGQLAEDFAPTVERTSPSRVRVRWRHAPGRGIMVRDAESGAILTMARGGTATVVTTARQLDLTFSNGVRSARRSMVVR